MKALLCLPALLLCACSSEPAASGNEPTEETVELTMPSDEEIEAIDAAVESAPDKINDANADVTLEELEAMIGDEGQ